MTVVAGADDESPRSVHSDDGSRASVDSSGSGSPRAQQQQSSGGKEEVLLEYEIEFVQVQVSMQLKLHPGGWLWLPKTCAC